MTSDHLRDTVQVEWSLSESERETLLEAVQEGQETAAMKWAAEYVCRPDIVAEELAGVLSHAEDDLQLTNRQLAVIQWCLVETVGDCELLERVREASDPIERVDPGGYSVGYRGTNWPEQREKALEAASRKCEQCGVSNEKHEQRHGRGLHVHHKTPFDRFNTAKRANELSNLEVLCQQCHPKREAES